MRRLWIFVQLILVLVVLMYGAWALSAAILPQGLLRAYFMRLFSARIGELTLAEKNTKERRLPMKNEAASSNLLHLLNQAIARELQVVIQYMLQHAIGAGQWSAVAGNTQPDKQVKFVASHAQLWLPGATLKKIAITEMRHAEAITERVVVLKGEPTTQPDPITIGTTAQEMLKYDREEERGAIELYRHIVDVAGKEGDDVTMRLFQRILADEEKHHRVFSSLLGED